MAATQDGLGRVARKRHGVLSRHPCVRFGPSFLTEDDIPGSSPIGTDANRLKNSELKFWLKCRGDSCKGLSTKAQLCKPTKQ